MRIYLDTYTKDGRLALFCQDQLPPGDLVEGILPSELARAHLAVVFVSHDYLQDEATYQALDTAPADPDHARVWVAATHGLYQDIPFCARTPCLLRAQPLRGLAPSERDRALVELAQYIAARCKDPAAAETRPTPPGILSAIRDQSSLVDTLNEDFVGRKILFERIQAFVAEQPSGYLVIATDPGVGKSAFAARLVSQHGYLHHFNLRREGICRPEQFLRNMCAKLIQRYALPYLSVPPEAEQGPAFLSRLLERVADNKGPEPLILVIDGLDETVKDPRHGRYNTLALPEELPRGVYAVVLTRPDWDHLTLYFTHHQTMEIDPRTTAWNLRDIEHYLAGRLTHPDIGDYIRLHGLTLPALNEELTRLSEGNFMYVKHMVPFLAQNKQRAPDSLPSGLTAYYDDHWQRMRMADERSWYAGKLDFLLLLSRMPCPVSLEQLVTHGFIKVADLHDIESVIREWRPFLHTVKGPEGHTYYCFYHHSFTTYLEDKQNDFSEHIDLRAVSSRISRVLIKIFLKKP